MTQNYIAPPFFPSSTWQLPSLKSFQGSPLLSPSLVSHMYVRMCLHAQIHVEIQSSESFLLYVWMYSFQDWWLWIGPPKTGAHPWVRPTLLLPIVLVVCSSLSEVGAHGMLLPFHVNVPTGTAIVSERQLHSRLPSVRTLTLSEPSSVLSSQPRFRIGMEGCRGWAHHSLFLFFHLLYLL